MKTTAESIDQKLTFVNNVRHRKTKTGNSYLFLSHFALFLVHCSPKLLSEFLFIEANAFFDGGNSFFLPFEPFHDHFLAILD